MRCPGLLTVQVQDKNWKIQVEKTEKERLKSDFQTRLNMNNKQWEKNLVRWYKSCTNFIMLIVSSGFEWERLFELSAACPFHNSRK